MDHRGERATWAPYDAMAEAYEDHAATNAYNAHYDRPALLDQVGDVEDLDVLDAACGAGYYTGELVARGARVSAFDGSTELVRIARAAHGDRARIDRADLDDPLPYPDASFDLVVCGLALHYATDRAATLAELARVLRPGGRCVLSTQHPTANWLHKGGSYFDVVLETDVWERSGQQHAVRWWREPLGSVCAAVTSAGFLIAALVEPLPAPTMREQWAEDDARLRQEPNFLVLDLIRP